MKSQLTILLSVISVALSTGQIPITKNEFELVLKETLKKSRNAVSDAENIWRYDNTHQDYFEKDTIILSTARSYRADYCKEIRWAFYENQKFILENIPECTEPPTKLKPTKEDYIEINCMEKNNKLYLILKNFKGISDKFKVLELTRNQPIQVEESAFDYTIKLLRKK